MTAQSAKGVVPAKTGHRFTKIMTTRSHIMMHFQTGCFRLRLGEHSETVCLGIAAYGQLNMLRHEIARFSRRQPVRLRRLPVNEEEIRIFLVNCRNGLRGTFLFQFLEDGCTGFVVHGFPQAFACQIAVVKLFLRRVQAPEIDKGMSHFLAVMG